MNKLRNLDFDDLLLLSQLADETTLTEVARKLGLSKSAISQRLKKWEDILGESLLERRGRTSRLTVNGRNAAIKAREAVKTMGNIFEDMAFDADPSG